ncbi:MAG: LLM class F420-dependent oxidoreductase [Acidimicrobiales bacterium]
MLFRIFIEPQQGASYEDQLHVAQAAERLGFDGFFRSDHYLKMGGVSGLPGPTDSWVALGAIARETSSIRIGTLLSSATFRLPGLLAISVAQVDEMSGGRVELGLGAGWYDDEHRAYGIPFPSMKERFDRLDEQLQVITGLWATPPGETFSFSGRHYTITGSPALPKPRQSPRPPVILGGFGPKRTPSLAARYADEFNMPFPSLEDFVRQSSTVNEVCEKQDRDPAALRRSVALVACVGENEAKFAKRAAAIGREPGELRENGAAGVPQEAIEKIAAYQEAGASTVYLQILDMGDLDHLELIWETVVTALC